jgi:predicted XRE-type DNA-binding protein
MASRSKHDVEEGSGNVFADLGFANPEQERLKAHLTLEIYKILKERGLRQSEAAKLLGTSQPRVSELMRGRSGAFSASRLMEFLTALGQDVEITVRPKRQREGKISVG